MVASVPGGFSGGIGTEVTLDPLGVAANAGIATNARVVDSQRSHFQQLVVTLMLLHLVFTTTVVEQEPQETTERLLLSLETLDSDLLDSDRR